MRVYIAESYPSRGRGYDSAYKLIEALGHEVLAISCSPEDLSKEVARRLAYKQIEDSSRVVFLVNPKLDPFLRDQLEHCRTVGRVYSSLESFLHEVFNPS